MGLINPTEQETRRVDQVLGHRKPGSPETSSIDWSDCPLAKRYPTWSVFLQRGALSENLTAGTVKRQYGTKEP
jgi:hypothetical protein